MLLLNFVLIKNGFPPIDIKNKDKGRYYDASQYALKGKIKYFVDLAVRYVKEIGEAS